MATSIHHPQDPYQVQQYNIHYRQTYAAQPPSFTPPSSVTPPNSNSKLSPTNVANAPKQIYAQRSCGYVPAALRPTTVQPRYRRPDTPPRSAQSSFESQSPPTSNSLPHTPADDMSSFMAPLQQVSRVVSDEWNEELGEVTGQPTRDHWKPDASVTCCTSPTCSIVFSFLARRHHCRRCGSIFCFAHSSRTVPLDQEARFHPKGVHGRSCDNCFGDYKIWQSERKSRASSINSGGTATPPAYGAAHLDIRGSDFLGIEPRKPLPRNNLSNQESVSDWNWSTF